MEQNELTKQKTVDVIIPTYHPGSRFSELLKMLQIQTYPVHRLIVINTEQSRMPAKLEKEVLSFGKDTVLRHIRAEEFDHAATRQMAAGLSDADILLFMTDDAVPEDAYLVERLVKAFETEGTAVAYARQMPLSDTGIIECYTRSFNYPEQSFRKSAADLDRLGIKTYFASNACCAYDRSIFAALGGFRGSAIFNEDMVYMAAAIRAGHSIAYVAEARVCHAHNYTALQQFHRNFDLGMSQAMHPEVFEGIRSEGEGIRLVTNTMKYLLKAGKPWLVPKLVIHSGCKYLGFKLGRSYQKLPRKLCVALAMNKAYVRRMEE